MIASSIFSTSHGLQFKRFVTVACILFAFAMVGLGQTSRGTVSGTVRDQNGAVVPGAQVVLVSGATAQERSAVTSGEGFYRFDAVDLGEYSLRFSGQGFGTVTKSGIAVSANQISSIDVELKLGTQEVTVDVTSGSGVEIQSESAVRGGNISQRQITELPIGGNPVALALTLPGVSTSRGGFGVGTFVVNGARGRSNNFLIDGTENNDISVAGQGFQITNQDAVQEVSVQTGNYDSEFGRAGGAVVNVITKSGTKNFHGTLGFEFDSSADDAVTAAQSRQPAVQARGRRLTTMEYTPSFTLGGPLFLPSFGEGVPPYLNRSRDKHFFFVAYEENRFRQPGGVATLSVPTAQGRAKLLQFAGGNPFLTTYLAATATTIAQTAIGTPIPLDAAGAPVVRGSVEIGNFFRSFNTTFTKKQFQIRTDHRLTDRDNLSFRYLQEKQVQPLGSEVNFPGYDSDFGANYKNFLIAETHVFSSSMTNELRLAYNLIDYDFFLADPSNNLPLISPGNGLTALGSATNLPQGRTANNYQVQDTLTKIFGNHTLRVGVDYLRQISTQIAPANVRGSITYAAGGGFQPLANFIDDFGGTGNSQKIFGNSAYHPQLHRTALFAHDRWKATPNLTLTAGLRWEYFGNAINSLRTPAFTGLFNVDPVTRTGPFSQPNKVDDDMNNFAPSVGFVWSPSYSSGLLGWMFGERKSAIRAGYNIGYDSFFNNIASNAAASSPNQVLTTISSTVSTAQPRGIPNFSSQFPAVARPLSALDSQTLVVKNLVNPYYQRWSFGMQRELFGGMVMDMSYVGSKGTKLYINEDANPLVRPDLRVTPINPTTGLPVTGSLSNRLDNIQGPRLTRTNGGDSNYHAGQIEVRRRFANNFQLTGAYTFSKMISNADEVFAAGLGSTLQQASIPAVFGGQSNDRARSIFDRTHRASFTYVFQSPFFKDQRGFIGKVLGGYQIGGITTFESGVPITIANGFDADGVGGALDRPTYNPNGTRNLRAYPIVNATTNAITHYINPSTGATIDPMTAMYIVNPTFVAGASGSVVRVGNLGRNTETSDGINNTDMTFLKRTRISETKYIDARAEMFNVWNHPQFGAGSTLAGSLTNATTWMQPINPTTSGGARIIRYQVKLVF